MDQIRPSASTPLSSLSLDQSRQAGKKPTMDQVGKAFESLFMQSMMKSMRDAQIEGGLLESEHSKPFQSLLDGIYSEMAVKRTNLGLADAIKRQFLARPDNKDGAFDGAQQASLNSPRSATVSSGLQMNVAGSSSALSGPLPIGGLSSNLATQQAASLKTTRPVSNHIGIPRALVAPKILTGD